MHMCAWEGNATGRNLARTCRTLHWIQLRILADAVAKGQRLTARSDVSLFLDDVSERCNLSADYCLNVSGVHD